MNRALIQAVIVVILATVAFAGYEFVRKPLHVRFVTTYGTRTHCSVHLIVAKELEALGHAVSFALPKVSAFHEVVCTFIKCD